MLIAAATACADEVADAGGRNVFMYRRSLIRSAAAAGLLPGAARAQSFPSKPLRLLVGAAAGGGADIVARILAQELTKSGELSVLVDNKPGASGTLATREMLRALADGHTILVADVGVLAVIPYASKDAGYDRPARRYRAGVPGGRFFQCAGRASRRAGQYARRVSCACPAAGRHGLRHGGRRHRRPSRRRAAEGAKRRAA
jgi:hypothetical protein